METSHVSHYRLQKTFEAGKTSYRLLMFLNVMRKEIRNARIYTDPNTGTPKLMTLAQLRDSLFARHGAPPIPRWGAGSLRPCQCPRRGAAAPR